MLYARWHSAAAIESCWMNHSRLVGVRFCFISHSSEGSVSSPACFKARIAKAVSRTFPQLFEDSLDFNSSTQSSKMLSGVARIVSAISWVVRPEQSEAFSSRHSKASWIFSLFVSGFVVVVVELEFVALSDRIRVDVNRISSRARNVTLFFMVDVGMCCL